MWLYHAVPSDQVGATLHPLATLRTLAPDAYERQAAKYRDDPRRSSIPQRRIAKLGCSGSEVINLSPVDPRLIYLAWRELGVDLGGASWYVIAADRVSSLPAVITPPERMPQAGADVGDDAVDWFDPGRYRELKELPERTMTWYRRLAETGRRGGWFVGIPHVLVHGSIDLSDVAVVDWSDGRSQGAGAHPLTGR